MEPIPPDTPEPRPDEPSVLMGLVVPGGMPLNMAGPLLKAIGSMYPASVVTYRADDEDDNDYIDIDEDTRDR